MKELEDEKYYTLPEVAEISGVREVTLRGRARADGFKQFKVINAVWHIKGIDAKELIKFRKRGKKEENVI